MSPSKFEIMLVAQEEIFSRKVMLIKKYLKKQEATKLVTCHCFRLTELSPSYCVMYKCFMSLKDHLTGLNGVTGSY